MFKDEQKQDCRFTGEIVPYLYDEIESSEQRIAFEDHLMDCVPCTDEFAAISNARFSVFEWQKIEFAPLATPAISIPYETQAASGSFIESIRGFFAAPAFRLSFAALLFVAVGVAFVAFRYNGVTEQTIASNANNVPSAAISPAPVMASLPVEVETPSKAVSGKEVRNDVLPEARPVKVAEIHHSPRMVRQLNVVAGVPSPEVKKNVAAQNVKKPVLNPYEDTDDKSLRLADLLDDEVGAVR